MDIFSKAGGKDKAETDQQRANMSEAAAERTKSDEAEAQGVWIEPDEADLASDDLRTT